MRVRRTVSPYDKDDVRYIPTIEEEIERYKAVTLEQVKKLYAEFLELAVRRVGDRRRFRSGREPQDLARHLRRLDSEAAVSPAFPRRCFPDVQGGIAADHHARQGQRRLRGGRGVSALKDSDPDYPAVVMGNYVLGGGSLSSRLGDRVRQKEGLSYGVGSLRLGRLARLRGSLTINAICNPKNIQKVNVAIGEELAKLLADGVTPDELDQAKQGYLAAAAGVAHQRRRRWPAMLADELYLDRTMAYLRRAGQRRSRRCTPPQVLAALQEVHRSQTPGDRRRRRLSRPSAGESEVAEVASRFAGDSDRKRHLPSCPLPQRLEHDDADGVRQVQAARLRANGNPQQPLAVWLRAATAASPATRCRTPARRPARSARRRSCGSAVLVKNQAVAQRQVCSTSACQSSTTSHSRCCQ